MGDHLSEPDREFIQFLLHRQEEFLLQRHISSLETLAGGVAHEFNNLLTGIAGYAQMALDNTSDTALAQRALGVCARAAQQGSELVRRLGHFARHDRPQMEVLRLEDVLNDVIELWRLDCEHYGITILAQYEECPHVRLDPTLFSIALGEILENAKQSILQYTESERTITLTCRKEDGDAVVRVHDTGAGMSPDEVESAFNPFFTTQGPTANGPQPLAKGIGLSSARGIVRTLGGDLTIEESSADGTEVRLQLPPARSIHMQKGRVLVVDDEAPIRRIFCKFLESAGFKVDQVSSGTQALDYLGTVQYQLILLDQMMPGMSGMEVLERLRDIGEDFPVPPVLMITASQTPDIARQALDLGARCCAFKPINRDKLLFLVESCTHPQTNPLLGTGVTEPAAGLADRILIVDANEIAREVLTLILEHANYRVTTVDSGTAALAATHDEYYDLILMDILLHDQPGEQVVQQLRANNPFTPILINSKTLSRQTVLKALEAGATQFIPKPVQAEPLIKAVNHLMHIFHSTHFTTENGGSA